MKPPLIQTPPELQTRPDDDNSAAPAARAQYAALPYRAAPHLEIMLISSRETRRWVIPKGWPMNGRAPNEAAAIEAVQEAGLVGEIAAAPIGVYRYLKRMPGGVEAPCVVSVFALSVERQRKKWPEMAERQTVWFSPEEAAGLVVEPELQALIRAFAAGWDAFADLGGARKRNSAKKNRSNRTKTAAMATPARREDARPSAKPLPAGQAAVVRKGAVKKALAKKGHTKKLAAKIAPKTAVKSARKGKSGKPAAPTANS